MSSNALQVEKAVAGEKGSNGGSSAAAAETMPARKPNEYASGSEVRWCPGCGDHAVLNVVKRALASIGTDPEQTAFISGIGCSSRFPYYMATYGIHGIHGRAMPIATGLKLARPELPVWVVSGDGDCMSIGGNHLIHALRRNIDLKILMFNNRIYGLTKGQASPTTQIGQITASTPFGVIEEPFKPLMLALGCDATFVARTLDMNPKHMQSVFERAAVHSGAAFVEIYQNCVIFNDGAYDSITNKENREDNILELEHGKPMIFGKNRDKGIRLNGFELEAVTIGENGVTEADILVHDEKAASPTLAYMLARMRHPQFPEPIGVLRAVDAPTADGAMMEQIAQLKQQKGDWDLAKILAGPETWVIE